MVWDQIEPTPPHLTYLLLSSFLILYCLFANFIRNRLHLSEPPIALVIGIILGPRVLGWLSPNFCGVNGCNEQMEGDDVGGWGWGDNVVQEAARFIVGIQVFAIGVELPKFYAGRHWKSVAMLLGPVMTFSWLICALFVALIFQTDAATALLVSACLTPTDPVLAASILSNSQFSNRIPKRLKDMLSAESGCNDGISFPFLYVGIFALTQSTAGEAIKSYALITLLWQVAFGTTIGLIIGTVFNKILRFADNRKFIDYAGFTVFYILLAVLCIGIGSTLGTDDFLVAFGAGYGFSRDGWFRKKTQQTHLGQIIDLLLNSAMFVYLGAIIPWYAFEPQSITPWITPGRLIAFLALVILFRRIPIVLLLYRWIPDIRTVREALFCGHFGPMGLGGIFLAMEARAMLENGSSIPDPHPPAYGRPYTDREKAVELVWPLVVFIVMGSTFIHGLSVLGLSIYTHLRRPKEARAPVLAGEDDPLMGMDHEHGNGDSEPSGSEDEAHAHGQP
jgi:sodium/hydrogen antiporter